MIQLNGRKIDEYGQVIFDEYGLCKVLMSGESIIDLTVESTTPIEQFTKLYKEWDNGDNIVSFYQIPDEPVSDFHQTRQSIWLMPDQYAKLDVQKWLFERCKTEIEIKRVILEYDLFCDRNIVSVLRYLIYLVDFMKEQNIIWGVGRGSSIASYCLYLIGIHRIDSIEYNLDIHEFLKT